jgi:NADH-quinone oxidoreductase subunit L
VPLMVLAVGSVLAGFLGVPALLGQPLGFPNYFEHFLEPVMAPAQPALAEVFTHVSHDHGLEWTLMGASVAVAFLGIGVAWAFYKRNPEIPERLAGSMAGLHRLLLNKYYVDELYGKVFVRGMTLGGGRTLHAMDRYVVDGGDGEVRPGLGVNGVAWATRNVVAGTSNFFDRWFVDGAVNLTAAVLDNFSYVFRSVQNGLVQSYALAMLIGVFLIIGAGHFVLKLY